MTEREIYLLSAKDLTPETIAVTFAKTSRSPLSFREIAAELTDEKSAQFHEKWVVGYGHASVAEHAVLHIAFENVSRLAIETIEGNRLASYTEKSTRYQKWDANSFHRPTEVIGSELAQMYEDTCRGLFQAYLDSLEPLKAVISQRYPQREGESDARYDGRIRSKYVDAARYLLPAAAMANVGMTANARVYEHAIRKMLSHPLAEVREIGAQVKDVSRNAAPTLVKYADQKPYIVETASRLESEASTLFTQPGSDAWLDLIDYTPDAEEKFLAACLYRFGVGSFNEALTQVKGMNTEQRDALLNEALSRLDRFDVPLRELEHITYTFDSMMDQGAYFEVKRHRMMSQTPQRLTTELGYATPSLFADAGIEADYHSAMDMADAAYHELSRVFNPHVAGYVVTNGHNRRLLMTLNLRDTFHFCRLRSAPNAHFGVRHIAHRMHEILMETHPTLTRYMMWDRNESWQDVHANNFTSLR